MKKMCLVIDTNTFASVFNASAADHNEFRPVLEWIKCGKGKIVYGGNKYKGELKESVKYLRLFNEFDAAGKVVKINDADVDREQNRIEKLIQHPNFNDPHIVAIIVASRCKLICSRDKTAYKFFKEKKLYPKKFTRPMIYSNISNIDLLCDQNIVSNCR